MKKIVIPAILTATILVAGMFAFMPVQKASTVHSTIGVAGKQIAGTPSVVGAVTTTVFDAGAGKSAVVWLDVDVTTALVGVGGGATVTCVDENGNTATAGTVTIGAAAAIGHSGEMRGFSCNKVNAVGTAPNTAGVLSVQGVTLG